MKLKPSTIITPVVYLGFGAAIALGIASHRMLARLAAVRDGEEYARAQITAGIESVHVREAALFIGLCSCVLGTLALFSRLKCESSDRIQWLRFAIFGSIALACGFTILVTFIFIQAYRAGIE